MPCMTSLRLSCDEGNHVNLYDQGGVQTLLETVKANCTLLTPTTSTSTSTSSRSGSSSDGGVSMFPSSSATVSMGRALPVDPVAANYATMALRFLVTHPAVRIRIIEEELVGAFYFPPDATPLSHRTTAAVSTSFLSFFTFSG
jgi:hypothetical protein